MREREELCYDVGYDKRTEPIKPPPTMKKEETPGIQSSLMLSKKEEKVDRR